MKPTKMKNLLLCLSFCFAFPLFSQVSTASDGSTGLLATRGEASNEGLNYLTESRIDLSVNNNNHSMEKMQSGVNQGKMERPKVIFFDVNETLLDLEPLKLSITKALGNRPDLGTLWFTTMLQYSLVVTVSGQYYDFGAIGAAALRMVAANNGIHITESEAMNYVKPILSLQPHPEVREALALLKANNYKMVAFTNSSTRAVNLQLKNADLTSYFDEIISVEDLGKFKPSTEAYHWIARRMQVENKDCILVAAHGWDIAGALWAGWNGAFVARPGAQLFPLAPLPQINHAELMSIAKELVSLK